MTLCCLGRRLAASAVSAALPGAPPHGDVPSVRRRVRLSFCSFPSPWDGAQLGVANTVQQRRSERPFVSPLLTSGSSTLPAGRAPGSPRLPWLLVT